MFSISCFHFEIAEGTTVAESLVTLLPPTAEIGVRLPARPQVGKLVVACSWLALYSTEP